MAAPTRGLLILLLILIAGTAPGVPGARAAGSRPNILVIMVDDLDVTTMQAALTVGLMPNLVKYIKSVGTEFAASFVTNPMCCPSRATFLTGQYSHNHKTYTNQHVNGAIVPFDDRSTLATWLQAAGYRTAHVGKYLNGYGAFHTLYRPEELDANRAIWDAAIGRDNRLKLEATYVPPGWDVWNGLVDFTTYCNYNYTLNENGSLVTYLKNGTVYQGTTPMPPNSGYGTPDNYQTDVLAKRAVDVITAGPSQPGTPWFLSLMPLAPHIETCTWSNDVYGDNGPVLGDGDTYADQFSATIRPAPRHAHLARPFTGIAAQYLAAKPSFNEADVSDKPQELQDKLQPLSDTDRNGVFRQFGDRLASLLAVDDLIGATGRALEITGQLSNTVIVFTSDNGWFYGEHRLSSKQLGYEESVRVPLFVRMPGGTASRTTRFVLNNDLAPTIVALAGALPLRVMDGRSLLPLLSPAPPATWRQQFLFEHYQTVWPADPLYQVHHSNLLGVKTTFDHPIPNYVYTEYFPGVQYQNGHYLEPPPVDDLGFPSTPPELSFFWEGPVVAAELYDVAADRYQLRNLLYEARAWPPAEQARLTALQDWMHQLLLEFAECQGIACRLLEDSGQR